MDQGIVLLIADDHNPIVELRGHLEQDGFAVEHHDSGQKALAPTRIVEPKAILVGDDPSDIDGFALTASIREMSDVPILMLRSQPSDTDAIVGLEVGADHFIALPVPPREVVARVRAVLRRSDGRPVQRSTMSIAGHVIDEGKRQVVTPSQHLVRLTAREFDLLWFLVANAGLVLSRDQILDAVWDYDSMAQERTIDGHVRQLRQKLPELSIETVWGVGFRVAG